MAGTIARTTTTATGMLHVHLHVCDLERSTAFYKRWFALEDGLDEGDIRFVVGRGVELALARDESVEALPAWFHWGFKLGSADDVEALYRQLLDASVPITKELYRDESIALFRLADPDGHQIEVYWD